MTIDLSLPMTQLQFGEMVGITQPAVSELVKAGHIPLGGTAGQWLAAYCARLREQAAGRLGTTEDSPDLVYERALLAREQRAIAGIKVAELRGETISVAAVTNEMARMLTGMRDGLMQLPARLSPVFAAETDQHKVHEIFEIEIHQALTQLAAAPWSRSRSANHDQVAP